MPHISLTMYKGRSQEEIEKISQALEKCLMDTVGWETGHISVSVKCTNPEEFTSTVENSLDGEVLIINSDLIK